jgi:hypothetical protein
MFGKYNGFVGKAGGFYMHVFSTKMASIFIHILIATKKRFAPWRSMYYCKRIIVMKSLLIYIKSYNQSLGSITGIKWFI